MCQRKRIKKAKQTPSGFIFFSILQVKGRETQGKEKKKNHKIQACLKALCDNKLRGLFLSKVFQTYC